MTRALMTGRSVAQVVRQRANDLKELTYTDDEILACINTAVRYLSLLLIQRRSPEMIEPVLVRDYMPMPEGFHSFVGENPVYAEGRVLRTYSGPDAEVPARFFCTREALTNLSEDVPFPDDYRDVIVEGAVSVLKSTDEFDVSAETELMDRMGRMLPGEAVQGS